MDVLTACTLTDDDTRWECEMAATDQWGEAIVQLKHRDEFIKQESTLSVVTSVQIPMF